MRTHLPAASAITGYAAALICANWLTTHFGLVPVGLGQTATAGTVAAGIALMLRNLVQDFTGRAGVVAAIVGGSLLSALTSAPTVALASGCAVLLSELADMALYTPLRQRGWVRAVVPATLLGALLDTVVFLSIAGFPVGPQIPGQMIGKAWAVALPVAAVLATRWYRARRAAAAA